METFFKFLIFSRFFKVLTVPMRNGNIKKEGWTWNYSSVLTVPMRNGNFLVASFGSTVASSSYRTYEEWKQELKIHPRYLLQGSYRTYEEWKLYDKKLCHGVWLASSYRTYEEWKRLFTPLLVSTSPVLTVPMRNGNWSTTELLWPCLYSSYRTYEEWKRHYTSSPSLVVPCSYRTYEEWKPKYRIWIKVIFDGFLPYLWGMETFRLFYRLKKLSHRSYRTYEEWKQVEIKAGNRDKERSYRTYEEWKLFQVFPLWQDSETFLPYLWGMETWHKFTYFLNIK